MTKPIGSKALINEIRSALTRKELSNESHRRSTYEPLKELAQLVSNSSNPDQVLGLISAHQRALFLILGGGMELYRSEGFLSEPQAPPSPVSEEYL